MSADLFERVIMRILFGSMIGTVYAGMISVIEPSLTLGWVAVVGGVTCVLLGIFTVIGAEAFMDAYVR